MKRITTFFEDKFREDTTLTITRTNPSYRFFISEYKHGIERDPNGNLMIRNERERLEKLKEHISQIILLGTDAYGYFINEYRENAPAQDSNGNILLTEEMVSGIKRH